VGKMRQRNGRTGLRAAGDVSELRGRSDSDQHVGPAATVHTQPASAILLRLGTARRRLADSAADLLPTCGQVRGARVPSPPPPSVRHSTPYGGGTVYRFYLFVFLHGI